MINIAITRLPDEGADLIRLTCTEEEDFLRRSRLFEHGLHYRLALKKIESFDEKDESFFMAKFSYGDKLPSRIRSPRGKDRCGPCRSSCYTLTARHLDSASRFRQTGNSTYMNTARGERHTLMKTAPNRMNTPEMRLITRSLSPKGIIKS